MKYINFSESEPSNLPLVAMESERNLGKYYNCYKSCIDFAKTLLDCPDLFSDEYKDCSVALIDKLFPQSHQALFSESKLRNECN